MSIGFLPILGTAISAPTGTTTTYMGRGAETGGGLNPCKGATTRACAIVNEKFAENSSGNGTIVTETITLFEENGEIHSVTTNTYFVDKSVEQTINESIEEHESNGGQVERKN